ncbi:regulatory protein RecX [Sphingorhabdus sp. EL138]|uniref:regulatory protein RecX n=1 Tax=Sphingorhabdus sp. EL138 TaxID=2073156 RepID=UPI000D687B37|nr:regulatory protein RecX [Sphingorhabdus sp. EL138]
MRDEALKNSGKALDENSLQELALRYVSRYATTRHKLKSYLFRKLRERHWSGDRSGSVEEIVETMVERFSELGYIDDALFAKNRAAALTNRGYGKRRVTQALYQAGIEEGDDRQALDLSDARQWDAARTYARKKSIGPFAQEPADQDRCRKQLQAFLRAGHSFDIASRFVFAKPGEEIDADV